MRKMLESLRKFFYSEKEKIKDLSLKKELEYIWMYYHLWILSILFAFILIVYIIHHRLTAPIDNWISVLFVNTYADCGNGSPFWKGFVEKNNLDTKEKNVHFNAQSYFNAGSEEYNEYYIYFVAYVEAGTLDAVFMETHDIEELGRSGRLLDLRDERAAQIYEEYKDRVVYTTLEETGEKIPVGIELGDTCLTDKYHVYAGPCAMALSVNVPHIDMVKAFLTYIMNGGE